jgi:hypothetical protein
VTAPIHDPYARGGEPGGDAPAPRADGRPQRDPARTPLVAALVLTSLAAIVAGAIAWSGALRPPPASGSVVVEAPTPSLLLAVRELSRLETAQVHVEKVVDLTDRQSRLFGLVESEDALLLVAVGRASVGVDLGALGPDDVRLDDATKKATITLPRPEVLSASLDEEATYVYRRETDLLAKRNERLESRARQAAVRAIEEAARTDDIMDRAKASAEKQLTSLARSLGAREVEVRWK